MSDLDLPLPSVGRQPELAGHVCALAERQTSAAPPELDGKLSVFMMRKHIEKCTPPEGSRRQ